MSVLPPKIKSKFLAADIVCCTYDLFQYVVFLPLPLVCSSFCLFLRFPRKNRVGSWWLFEWLSKKSVLCLLEDGTGEERIIRAMYRESS